MKKLFYSSIVAGALALAIPAAPANAANTRPKNATAQCKDGTYSTARTKQGACSSHGGVDTWLADAKAETKSEARSSRSEVTAATKSQAKPSDERHAATKDASKPSAIPPKAGDPTAQCNDGTYSYAVHHQGACSGHQGVKSWFK